MDKKRPELIIGGKSYTIGGNEDQDYLQEVAAYLQEKMQELEAYTRNSYVSERRKSILLALNIADDYFQLKEEVKQLKQQLEDKEKEIYDLEYELISEKIKD